MILLFGFDIPIKSQPAAKGNRKMIKNFCKSSFQFTQSIVK